MRPLSVVLALLAAAANAKASDVVQMPIVIEIGSGCVITVDGKEIDRAAFDEIIRNSGDRPAQIVGSRNVDGSVSDAGCIRIGQTGSAPSTSSSNHNFP